MKRAGTLFVCFALLVGIAGVQAEDLYRFYSPKILAEGDSVVSMQSPLADTMNPAASGLQQRLTLDFNFLALPNFGTDVGTAWNLGASYPTSMGVFSGSLHLLFSPAVLALGNLGTIHMSFAKDLYPNLLVGAGVHATVGGLAGQDWAVGMDLGFIHMPDNFLSLRNFRWGGVLRNMGYHAGTVYPVFSPAFGASFTAFSAGDFSLDVTSNFSFHLISKGYTGFADSRAHMKLGTSLMYRNFLSLDANVRGAVNPGEFDLSLGLSVTLNRNRTAGEPSAGAPWKTNEIGIQTAASPLFTDNLYAFGAGLHVPLGIVDITPPSIAVEYPQVSYLSPNHDGKADSLEFALSVRDERFIKGYRFVVKDESGKIVREIWNKEERPENATFTNIMDRLTYVKTGIPVPDNLRWDGTNDSGEIVADGPYTFFVEAWDDNGNVGRSSALSVVVDTTAPMVEVKIPSNPAELNFSPNDDGNKDTLLIVQSGSKEDLWEGRILDAAGQVVKTYVWKNDGPASFPWDGKNLEGVLAPDGVYSYVIASTDRAANSGELRLDNIIINTQQPPINLSILSSYFSPNGDGVQDTIELIPEVPVRTGIVNWSLSVVDERGTVFRRIKGNETVSSEIPEQVFLDGKADNGSVLPEGRYRTLLKVLYQNGHSPSATSPFFTLDSTAPTSHVSTNHSVFSPNGDGHKDTVTFYQDTSREEIWQGSITDRTGRIIREYTWQPNADVSFIWDGRGKDNLIVPDGMYYYALTSTDRAGNRGSSQNTPVLVNTVETHVALSTLDDAFSPNGDGLKDRMEIIPQIRVSEGIEMWELSVHAEKGELIRTQKANRREGLQWSWDGISGTGGKSPDGRYYAQLRLRYVNGNEPVAKTGLFLLDTVPPWTETRANYTVFSPDGDGQKDEITFFQETSKEARWIGTIVNTMGKVVKSFSWIDEGERSVTWDGRGDDKLVQPDGFYIYRLSAIDLAGNKGASEPVTLEINTEETPLFLSAEFDAFSPNGDGTKDRIRLLPQIKVIDGIQSFACNILSADGEVVRSYEGAGPALPVFEWDGLTDAGVNATDGTYTGRLTLVYINGNAPVAKTSAFILDTTHPKATVTGDYRVFSPNGDGNKDIITFTQETSREETWTGTVTNSEERVIRIFTWRGTAESRLYWDGRGNDKSIVPDGIYTYRLSAIDDAGNRGSSGIARFEVNTTETPVFIGSEFDAFSPNADGIRDTVGLLPQVRVERGIERWEIRILAGDGQVMRSFSGLRTVPRPTLWDGMDTGGRVCLDGEYTAELSVVYENGNISSSRTREIVLDTVYPEVRVSMDSTLFSPNGDGLKDTVTIRQSSTVEDWWEGRIVAGGGETVRSYGWLERAPDLVWDGLDENGNRVKDGEYRYIVTATDSAGNTIERRSDPITVDTRIASVFVTSNRTGFSPNGDGELDDITFSLIVNLKDGVASWSLAIIDRTGMVRKEFSGSGLPPATLVWNGRDESGQVGEDVYTARFSVTYEKGDQPTASTNDFTLDVMPPQLDITLKPVPFSPDNDGVNDEIIIGLSVRDRNPIARWRLDILDPTGQIFISYNGTGAPAGRIIWDGRSRSAELVQAAEDYPYIFTATDSLGNTGREEGVIPVDVLVMREGDKLKIKISSITFPAYRSDIVWQDADASEKNVRILKRLAEILNKYASYKVRIEGHAVSEFWNTPARAEKEELEELQPLSLARADAVRNKLAEFGVDPSRVSSAGRGGTEPAVPHGDVENRWKNRRVEFILLR